MALDVYVGTLTRYFTGDWETVAQRYARETGMEIQIIRPGMEPGQEPERPEAAEVEEAVAAWKAYLSEAIKVPLDWPEGIGPDYHTDRPAWDGYASLLLWAAYDEHPDLERPYGSVTVWDDDPAYRRAVAEGSGTRYYQLLKGQEVWLPAEMEMSFSAGFLNGQAKIYGSVPALLASLEELNRRTWSANELDFAKWRYDGCEPGAPLEVAAKFGFSIFREMARLAAKDRLVMLLDY